MKNETRTSKKLETNENIRKALALVLKEKFRGQAIKTITLNTELFIKRLKMIL